MCIALVLALVAVVAALPLPAASELEQNLRDRYNGKTLVLRNFYAGDSLQYDASGRFSRSADSGDWTVDGFVRVDNVKVSGQRLTIQAKRLHMVRTRDGGFAPVPSPAKKLRIEADVNPGEGTPDRAEALLARIFLTSQDHFAELLPDYWKPCVIAGLTGKDSQKYTGCHFPAEVLAIPGVAYRPDQRPPELADAAGPIASGKVFHGKGVTMPKGLYLPQPGFSEDARQAKCQGAVTLMLVVDKTGGVRSIRIVSPMGCGLDGKAVGAVEKWQFNPGTKDGEPVDVEIGVEVNFHLY